MPGAFFAVFKRIKAVLGEIWGCRIWGSGMRRKHMLAATEPDLTVPGMPLRSKAAGGRLVVGIWMRGVRCKSRVPDRGLAGSGDGNVPNSGSGESLVVEYPDAPAPGSGPAPAPNRDARGTPRPGPPPRPTAASPSNHTNSPPLLQRDNTMYIGRDERISRSDRK